MYCSDNRCTQETACYVKNYGAIDTAGNPFAAFGDKAAALQALRARKHFATVAMVERQWMDVGRDTGVSNRPPNTVLFMAFDKDDNLATGPVKLDTKGFNTFNPGNCLTCHGTSGRYDTDTHTVSGAYFLPFDLQSFEYFSEIPTNPLSREFQERNFKALNKLVYFSDLFFLDAPRQIITRWYTAPGTDSFSSSTFLDNRVPFGWDTNGNSRQLYRQVVAKACRTCHISEENPTLAFGTQRDFLLHLPVVTTDVCGPQKYMPQAEQTVRLFWESSARSHLLNRSVIRTTGCGFEVSDLP